MTATAMTTIHCLVVAGSRQVRRQTTARGGRRTARAMSRRRLLDMVAVAPVDAGVLLAATLTGFSDYEDAVVYAATLAHGGCPRRDWSRILLTR